MLNRIDFGQITDNFYAWGFGVSLLGVGVVWGFPFIYGVLSSLKPTPEIYRWPPTLLPQNPTFAPYLDMFNRVPFGRYYFNSLFVCTIATLVVMIFGSMAGYAFSKLKIPGKSVLLLVILGTIMVPPQALLIPLFLVLNALRVLDTYFALILPYAALHLPFAVFIFTGFFDQIPDDLQDCARVDGASWYTIFYRIMVPLARPALATVAIFSFIGSWKDFIIALTMTNSQSMRTVPVGIAEIEASNPGMNLLMAAAMFASIPMVLVFLLMQKQFIKGLTGGAVKG